MKLLIIKISTPNLYNNIKIEPWITKKKTFDRLKRYTGTDPGDYGDWILLTNFQNYVEKFADKFTTKINGLGGPMTSAINKDGLSIINFGIGSANAATIMDLLSCIKPKGVLFLGKCGGLKKPLKLGILFYLQHPLEVKVQKWWLLS